MSIIIQNNPNALWEQILVEGEKSCSQRLPENLKKYLVFMLIRYAHEPSIVKEVLAEKFLESATHRFQARILGFQYVGDLCLLYAGFFPAQASKKLVKISYFIQLGQSAYAAISRQKHDIYADLSKEFVLLMDVLQATRGLAWQAPDLLPLEAYELWQETGSLRALNVLNKYIGKGALPTISTKKS